MAAVFSSTCSGVIFSLYSICTGEVAMNKWMRGSAAHFTASQAASMSPVFARAREATVQSRTVLAMVFTDSKSPGEERAKPASITSTFIRSRQRATSIFSCRFMLQPGDCSPSRRVVSNILIRSMYIFSFILMIKNRMTSAKSHTVQTLFTVFSRSFSRALRKACLLRRSGTTFSTISQYHNQ